VVFRKKKVVEKATPYLLGFLVIGTIGTIIYKYYGNSKPSI